MRAPLPYVLRPLYRHPFLTWALVKRHIDELGRRLEKVVIQEEPGPSQEEGQAALPSVGSDGYVPSNFDPAESFVLRRPASPLEQGGLPSVGGQHPVPLSSGGRTPCPFGCSTVLPGVGHSVVQQPQI